MNSRMPPWIAVGALALLGSLFLISPLWSAMPTPDTLYTVDTNMDIGVNASLALDSQGIPHVVSRRNDSTLYYAKWADAWVAQSAPGGSIGNALSLLIDPADHPHLIFSGSTFGIQYASWTGTGWSQQSLPETSRAEDIAFVLDGAANPHVVYEDTTLQQLKYAHWNGSAWTITTVMGGMAYCTSIAVDSAGVPQISFKQGTDVKYAKLSGGTWVVQTVETILTDNPPPHGLSTSLALDGYGNPIIAYSTGASRAKLKLAKLVAGSWSIQIVDSGEYFSDLVTRSSVGWYPALSLDGNGTPHILYYDKDLTVVKYAVLSGTRWIVSTLDPTLTVGLGASAAIDGTGNLHIAYLKSSGDLRYMQLNEGQWLLETIDSTDSGDSNLPTVMDSTGLPHVAYYSGGAIKHAWRTPSGWQTNVVNNNAFLDWKIGLAMDVSGLPHVLDFDTPLNTVVHQVWDGSAWSKEVVGAAGAGDGTNGALAIDGVGTVHVLFDAAVTSNIMQSLKSGGAWNTTPTLQQGHHLSQALDSVNHSHATATRPTNGVTYSSFTGVGWTPPVVLDATARRSSLSLFADLPQVSYITPNSVTFYRLYYKQWTGSSWSAAQLIDSKASSNSNTTTSLSLDSSGNPFIAYAGSPNEKFARWTGDHWILTQTEAGLISSILRDASGKVHWYYAATAATPPDLRYAEWTPGGVRALGGGNLHSRPQAPTGLTPATVTLSNVTWTWTDNASNELGFRLYGSTSSAGPYTLIADETQLGPNSAAFSESKLLGNTTYYRYVTAVNNGNIAFSNMASVYLTQNLKRYIKITARTTAGHSPVTLTSYVAITENGLGHVIGQTLTK